MPELEPRTEALAGVLTDDIVTIVSGLPRSGTSLMMQVLEAAGIPPFTDNERQPDESNKMGYYEHAKVTTLLSNPDRSWIKDAKGKATKVVAPLLASLPRKLSKPDSQPEELHYRVLFMERDMDEIVQSQKAMLQRLGKLDAGSKSAGDVAKAYRQQERHAKTWCLRLGIPAMSVNFHNLVHDSEKVLREVARFLGVIDKLSAMHACINPALHRARKDPPHSSTTENSVQPGKILDAAIC
jgi:hypothetical protein